MLSRNLNNLEHQDFGYRTEGRMLVAIRTPRSDYTTPRLTALYRDIERRLKALPGVEGGGLALYNPMTDNWGEWVFVAGHPPGTMNSEDQCVLGSASAPTVRESRHDHAARASVCRKPIMKRQRPWQGVVQRGLREALFKDGEDPMEQHFGLDLPRMPRTTGLWA